MLGCGALSGTCLRQECYRLSVHVLALISVPASLMQKCPCCTAFSSEVSLSKCTGVAGLHYAAVAVIRKQFHLSLLPPSAMVCGLVWSCTVFSVYYNSVTMRKRVAMMGICNVLFSHSPSRRASDTYHSLSHSAMYLLVSLCVCSVLDQSVSSFVVFMVPVSADRGRRQCSAFVEKA